MGFAIHIPPLEGMFSNIRNAGKQRVNFCQLDDDDDGLGGVALHA